MVFRYWKGGRSKDDKRRINRLKRIFSRFVGILKKLDNKGKDSRRLDKFYFIGVMN